MRILDIVLLGLIALAVFFALRRIIKKRKSGCSCGCAACSRSCTMAGRK